MTSLEVREQLVTRTCVDVSQFLFINFLFRMQGRPIWYCGGNGSLGRLDKVLQAYNFPLAHSIFKEINLVSYTDSSDVICNLSASAYPIPGTSMMSSRTCSPDFILIRSACRGVAGWLTWSALILRVCRIFLTSFDQVKTGEIYCMVLCMLLSRRSTHSTLTTLAKRSRLSWVRNS